MQLLPVQDPKFFARVVDLICRQDEGAAALPPVEDVASLLEVDEPAAAGILESIREFLDEIILAEGWSSDDFCDKLREKLLSADGFFEE